MDSEAVGSGFAGSTASSGAAEGVPAHAETPTATVTIRQRTTLDALRMRSC